MTDRARTPFLAPLLHWLLLGGVLGLALLFVATKPLPTNDYSIYVAMGRQMLAQRALLEHDPFTFTVHGEAFQHASWAYAILCALSHRLSGYQGIRLLVVLSLGATLVGIYLAARRAGASPRAASAASAFTWLMLLQNTGPRGQTLIYPLFVVLMMVLLRSQRPWLSAATGLVLGWVWTQLHGSFPIPILYAGAIATGTAIHHRDLRAALPAALLTCGLIAGTMLGPYGPTIYAYVHENGSVLRSRGMVEWYATTLDSFAGLRLYGALALWTVLLLRSPRRLPPASWLVLLGFAFMAVSAMRCIAWFGLATAVPLAVVLTPDAQRGAHVPPLTQRQGGLLALLGVGWTVLLACGVPRAPMLAPDTPVQLAETLAKDADSGRLFAPFESSSYFAWRFHEPSADPAVPLGYTPWPYFLDMRSWIYDEETWSEYVSISAAEPGWQEKLDRRQVTHLLLAHDYHGEGLLPAARASSHWQVLAEDGSGVLFHRAPP